MKNPSDVALIVLSDEVRHMPVEDLRQTVSQLFNQAGLHKDTEN